MKNLVYRHLVALISGLFLCKSACLSAAESPNGNVGIHGIGTWDGIVETHQATSALKAGIPTIETDLVLHIGLLIPTILQSGSTSVYVMDEKTLNSVRAILRSISVNGYKQIYTQLNQLGVALNGIAYIKPFDVGGLPTGWEVRTTTNRVQDSGEYCATIDFYFRQPLQPSTADDEDPLVVAPDVDDYLNSKFSRPQTGVGNPDTGGDCVKQNVQDGIARGILRI